MYLCIRILNILNVLISNNIKIFDRKLKKPTTHWKMMTKKMIKLKKKYNKT